MSEIRNTGVIYNGMFEQINQVRQTDEKLAGELAIAYFEQVLTSEVTSTNPMVQALVAAYNPIVSKDKEEWEKEREIKREEKIRNNKLRQIAKFYFDEKLTQEAIAAKLNMSVSTVSRRIKLIKTDFPELMIIKKKTMEKDELEKIVGSF